MLRRIRHKLRMINYYSARRPESGWTRAMDIAMLASLVLALPATWICNLTVSRLETAIELAGHFVQHANGSLAAVLIMPDKGRTTFSDSKPLGNFQFTVRDERRGWPLTTTYLRHPARLDVDLLSEPRARKNAQLTSDDPLRIAIEESLRQDDRSEALEAWRSSGVQREDRWLAWGASTTLWWIVLVFTSSIAISLVSYMMRIGQSAIKARRSQRAAEGKCAHCGYDMTGLEFNERCPECGSIVW